MATRWWKKFKDTFIRFDMIHERDRQTDGQTLHDSTDRACIASHGKNHEWIEINMIRIHLVIISSAAILV